MEVLRSVLVEKKQWMLKGLGCYFKQFQITGLNEMLKLERFSYDLEMKTREQNRNNKRTEIERFDWFIKRIQTRVAFGWLSERSAENTSMPEELSRNQLILRFHVILQRDWPIEQCLLHIRVFFGRKKKSPCLDLFIHWLINK